MKLIDAIFNVDKSVDNSDSVCVAKLREALGLECDYNNPPDYYDRVKSYWLSRWLCTDTWVGFRVLFFDNQPVATVFQSARKNNKEFKFFPSDPPFWIYGVVELRKYLIPPVDDTFPTVYSLDELNEDVGDHYTVSFGQELLTKEGLYDGRPVKVVKIFENIDNWHFVRVQDEDGAVTKIHLDDFHIPLRIVKAT